MFDTLSCLVKRLESAPTDEIKLIEWGSPIPSFGDISSSTIATVGLNPSNREFVSAEGNELNGTGRRFHTLRSLKIKRWQDVRHRHLELILESCSNYFSNNPYDHWFKELDNLLVGTNASYYGKTPSACHLDLIPYATVCKWAELTNRQQVSLINFAGDTLGLLLKNSPIRVLVLNGQTVVQNLQRLANVEFKKAEKRSWKLPRKNSAGVPGYAYTGRIRQISGICLKQDIVVLGFNHNIQSSFGVTSQVKNAIRRWITAEVKGIKF